MSCQVPTVGNWTKDLELDFFSSSYVDMWTDYTSTCTH